jgi:hypothetical protein
VFGPAEISVHDHSAAEINFSAAIEQRPEINFVCMPLA